MSCWIVGVVLTFIGWWVEVFLKNQQMKKMNVQLYHQDREIRALQAELAEAKEAHETYVRRIKSAAEGLVWE